VAASRCEASALDASPTANSIAANVEVRHRVFSIHVASTHVDIELTPFINTGRVFSHGNPVPLSELHTVGGLGFRGVAQPFVVGYMDVGMAVREWQYSRGSITPSDCPVRSVLIDGRPLAQRPGAEA
jgi:hypothetical protein